MHTFKNLIQTFIKNKIRNEYQKSVNKIKTFYPVNCHCIWLYCFLMFHYIKALSPLKPVAYVVSDCLPGVLFVILFCAFIKIEYKQMKPHVWHYVLIAFQVLASLFCLSMFI